jgi:hypothetical protein
VTPARVKRHSSVPRGSGRPSRPPDDANQLASGTRIKRAAIHPASEREAIEASIDAALRELDSLEAVSPRKKTVGRRVPPFPGTGLTRAVPPLPSMRPTRSARPKKDG